MSQHPIQPIYLLCARPDSDWAVWYNMLLGGRWVLSWAEGLQ